MSDTCGCGHESLEHEDLVGPCDADGCKCSEFLEIPPELEQVYDGADAYRQRQAELDAEDEAESEEGLLNLMGRERE